MVKILLVQGPNMAYLGKRQPEIYGTMTAKELDLLCMNHAHKYQYELEIMYSNAEGAVVDRLYAAVEKGLDGLVMNPAAMLYAGYALRSCIQAICIPYIEVHIANIGARTTTSILAPVAHGVVLGFGIDSYRMGLEAMIRLLTKNESWD